jgi:hypothetical protein
VEHVADELGCVFLLPLKHCTLLTHVICSCLDSHSFVFLSSSFSFTF